ncbi:GDSL-type esterase/lipase family protein [Ningiella sp. W23]|uniref:SGNH/GDSL hydrolase family protein n=1 Tax=Ningiella sp. W23 TaxID=3023715 RepID=UPI003756673E
MLHALKHNCCSHPILKVLAFAYVALNATSSNASESNAVAIANNPNIHVMGRSLINAYEGDAKSDSPSEVIKMSYPGVTLLFNALAKRVTLTARSNSGRGRIDVVIDGEFSHTLDISKELNTYPITYSETVARHQVQLVNRSESWQSINELHSLTLEQGALASPPKLPSRNILVVGDSVSCGAAVSRGAQCDTKINGHDARSSYGYKLGEKLDANVHLVCFGGRGIIRSWNENPDDIQAPAFFEKSLPFENIDAPWDHAQYQPEAVIVSLGTNDFNPGIPDRRKFVSAYVQFVQRIAQVHPKAMIMITEGAMLNNGVPERQNKTVVQGYLSEVVEQANVDSLVYEKANHYPGDSCDPHPTAKQHEKMAQDLEQSLRQRLNW